MTIEIWLAFVAAVAVFFVIPGPTMILVVSEAINHGKKSVIPLVSGVLLGDFVAMSLSLLGLGAILATSASLFLVLKWLGVCYLIYLGVKTWRQAPTLFSNNNSDHDDSGASSKKMLSSAFIVTALNPKDIIFFVAFLPQFVNPTSPVLPQLLILMATFLIIDMLNIFLYTVFARTMRSKISNVKTQVRINQVGGSALIGAGMIAASIQRA